MPQRSLSSRKIHEEKSLNKKTFAIVGLSLVLVLLIGFLRYGYFRYFPNPQVEITSTADSPLIITPNGAFLLAFDQRMNKESVKKAVSIHPALPLNHVWEGKTLFLKTDALLKQGDQYSVTVQSTAKNIFGQALQKAYTTHYLVGESPSVGGVFPEGEELQKDDLVSILFTHPMRYSILDKPYSPISMSPEVPGEWIWHNSKTLVFHPQEFFPGSTKIRFYNDEKLLTLDGSELKNAFEKSYVTPRLEAISEFSEAKKVNHLEPLKIEFSEPVNREKFKRSVSLIDGSGGKVEYQLSTDEEKKTYELLPKVGHWAFAGDYKLLVSEGLLPQEGNLGLEKNIEWDFSSEAFISLETHGDLSPYLDSENSIIFKTYRDINKDVLRSMLTITPDVSFGLEKKQENTFEIKIADVSQNRENYKLYTKGEFSINEAQKVLIDEQHSLVYAPLINPEIISREGRLCVKTDTPLLTVNSFGSFTLAESDESETRLRLLETEDEFCNEVFADSQSSFLYTVDTARLEPGVNYNATFVYKDVFSQVFENTITFDTEKLTNDQISLESQISIFYQNVEQKNDLQFRYSAKNAKRRKIDICKLSVIDALQIETQYEKRWFGFNPSSENCLRYKSYYEDDDPSWGRKKNYIVDVSKQLDDVDTGFYFVQVSLPGYTDERGEQLKVQVGIQWSPWKLLSKRGSSSLAWVYNNQNSQVENGINVKYYSNDGVLLHSGFTDEEGLYFIEKNQLKYDYIVLQKGLEELLLDAFAQEGFSPQQFNIPLDVEQQRLRYQFVLEEPSVSSRNIHGLFIAKEEQDGQLVVPNISEGIVTLYDQKENLLWRRYEPFDEFGNLQIEITPTQILPDGLYELGVCIGLHQGVCQGEYYWVNFQKGDTASVLVSNPEKEQVTNLQIGDVVSPEIEGLVPGVPILVTIEKDEIYQHQVLDYEDLKNGYEITVLNEFVPEFVLTLLQYQQEKAFYSAKRYFVDQDSKILEKADLSDLTMYAFDLSDHGTVPYDNELVKRFYPRTGTSIITSSNTVSSQVDYSSYAKPYTAVENDLLLIPGKFLGRVTEQKEDLYLLAHNQKGNFIDFSNHQQTDSEVTAHLKTPAFFRGEERISLEGYVENTGDQKNIQANISSKELNLQESFFMGVSRGQKNSFQFPTSLNQSNQLNKITFDLSVQDKNEQLYSSSYVVPVASSLSGYKEREVFNTQVIQEEKNIQLPMPKEGLWNQKVIVSTTPIAYVLEALQEFLSEPVIFETQVTLKSGVYSNYISLMSQKNIEWEFLLEHEEILKNELVLLEQMQNVDGSWGESLGETLLVVRHLSIFRDAGYELDQSVLVNARNYLKGILDESFNERLRSQLDVSQISTTQIIQEIKTLQALSSLAASGMYYAEEWYGVKENLPNDAVVHLLLTCENYRDAGVQGMQFRIEELVQLLQKRREEENGFIWLKSETGSSFSLSALYLESLVRQASNRTELPDVIQWLIQKKYDEKYSSSEDRSYFLHAMAAYLKLFQEQINASSIAVTINDQRGSFELSGSGSLNTFVKNTQLLIDEETSSELVLESDALQPLFIEVLWERSEKLLNQQSEGISLYHHLERRQLNKGESVAGEIVIISPREYEDAVIIHPQVAGGAIKLQEFNSLKTISNGVHEKWHILDTLPKGITRIPFEWSAEFQGVYEFPPLQLKLPHSPEVYATSQQVPVQVR